MYGHNNSQVRVLDFILSQTGTYQEQTIRPFETTVASDYLTELETVTRGGTNLSASAVQGVASKIIHPSGTPEGVASIREGWRSRRFRFLMRVEEVHPFNPNERVQRVYFGYTDNCDVSTNHLDPDMRIYFNSETIFRDYVRPTPNGLQKTTRVEGSNQIVSPIDMANSGTSAFYSAPTAFMIRPEDIFLKNQTDHIAEKLQQTGVIGHTSVRYDTRAMAGQGGSYKYSRRRDTTPSRYLSDTLRAYKHGVEETALSGEEGFGGGTDMELVYEHAQSQVANQDISASTFFSVLKDRAGFLERGYVTYGELTQIFPETVPYKTHGGCTHYALDDGRSIRQVSYAEDSEHWNGSEPITIAATTLAQIIPAVMMDNFIRSISFAVTNGHGLGNYIIDFHGETLRGIVDGVPLGPYLQEFERRLIFDALNAITHNNQVSFQLGMSCDLAGDSIIDISLGTEPVRRYIAPTFSDSLFTPVVTNDYSRQDKIASDLIFMLQNAIPTERSGSYSTPIEISTDTRQSYSTGYSSADGSLHPFNLGNDDDSDDHSGLL